MIKTRLAFTATRKGTGDFGSRSIIRARLRSLDEPSEVTTGGALEGDTVIAVEAIALWPKAFHRLVLPKVPGNPALVEWFEAELEAGRIDGEVVRTGLPPLKRNHDILDHGDRLEAFPWQHEEPSNPRTGGGTWATIRYARKRRMPIQLTPVGPAP